VFYLSTAPSLFTTICEKLAAAGLVDANARVVLEKPLGTDLASAIEINEAVGQHFAESQIYRIDHYLGKETVQNLMVLRFGNSILEPLWRAPNISSVQITVAEEVGVGSRAGFYDGAGAMRDMVQNHLLQLLCIVAMEPPTSLNADAVRDEKLKVLRSLRRFTLADIARDTVRGQYTRGVSGNQEVPGYHEEKNVPPDSKTETFVALRTFIDTWRWSKVPFYLRTGKRMERRSSKIVIEFTNPAVPAVPGRAGRRRQPPRHRTAARGSDQAAADGQGARQRHAHAAGGAEPRPAIGLPAAPRRSLRAPADRRRARPPDPLHAPRRAGSGLGMGRPDHRGLGHAGREAACLRGRIARAGGIVRAAGAGWL
jgi:hypothetical protein